MTDDTDWRRSRSLRLKLQAPYLSEVIKNQSPQVAPGSRHIKSNKDQSPELHKYFHDSVCAFKVDTNFCIFGMNESTINKLKHAYVTCNLFKLQTPIRQKSMRVDTLAEKES